MDKVFVDKVCVDKVWRRAEEEKAEEEPGIQNQRCGEKQHFFFWSAPVAFRRVALETPEWTSRDSNHHRQSVSAGKRRKKNNKTTNTERPSPKRNKTRPGTKDGSESNQCRTRKNQNMMGGPGGDRIPHQPAKRPPQNRSKWEQIILWRSKDEGTGSNTIEPKARGEEEEEEGRYV